MFSIDVARVRVVAFDLFGTVYSFDGVDRAAVGRYVEHTRSPIWAPLELPESWSRLEAFPDSAEGIARIRAKLLAITLSNAPLALQLRLARFNGVTFDCLFPLELGQVYKPRPRAYELAYETLELDPASFLMVTANERFGDLEASRALGMQAVLIRGESGPRTIVELAELLGC